MRLLRLTLLCAVADALPRLNHIFLAHTHNYSCYRIPSAVQAPSGALLVFVEARHSVRCDDGDPLNDVVFARSKDNGTTWSAPIVVFPGRGLLNYRNPTAVFSRTGSLILQFVNATTGPWHTLQMVSHDEGGTWTAPYDPMLGVADSFLAGPGNGLLLTQRSPAPGRLVFCGTNLYDSTRSPTAPVGARVWVSDSDGDRGSWTSTPALLAPRMSECALAELTNGSVLINFRAEHINKECLCRSQMRSDDGGASWSPLAYVPDLIEPVCSAGLLQLSNQQGLLFSNPASDTQRVNMTVRRSRDGGLTWPDKALISPAGAAYSVLVPVSSEGGAAGIVFETMDATGYSGIVFALVPPF